MGKIRKTYWRTVPGTVRKMEQNGCKTTVLQPFCQQSEVTLSSRQGHFTHKVSI